MKSPLESIVILSRELKIMNNKWTELIRNSWITLLKSSGDIEYRGLHLVPFVKIIILFGPNILFLQMQQELFDVYLELLDSYLATQSSAELLTEVM